MNKRCLNLCLIAMAVLLSGYVGYRFYVTRVETALSTSIAKQVQFDPNNAITATDRAFLRQAEVVSQQPREIEKRFPSLKLPTWVYTPAKWDSDRFSPIKVIFQQVDVVVFEAVEMPNHSRHGARAFEGTGTPRTRCSWWSRRSIHKKSPNSRRSLPIFITIFHPAMWIPIRQIRPQSHIH